MTKRLLLTFFWKLTIDFFPQKGDGRVCIRFGMVSADTDVEELLALVVRTGTELDEQV